MKNRYGAVALYVLLAALVAGFSVTVGQFEYGSYDLSALVDTSWRLHNGQLPLRDFPCLLPPTFYLLGWAAFSLFGIRWWAFSAINILCYAVLLGLGCNALRSLQNRVYARRLMFGQLIALSVPLLITSHLWHSTLTQMLSVTLLLLTAVLWHEAEHGREPHGSLWASLVLVAGMLCWAKPNLAVPALLAFAALPLLVPGRRRMFRVHGIILVAGAAWSSLLLLSLSLSPLQTIMGYGTVSGRPAARFLMEQLPVGLFKDGLYLSLDDALVCYLVVGATGLGALWMMARRRASVPPWVPLLILTGSGLSLVGFATDWDNRSNDLATGLFGLLLLLVHLSGTTRAWRLVGGALVGLSLISSVALGVTRYRMKAIGSWAGSPSGALSIRQDRFFGRFDGRERFWQTIAGADQAVLAHPGLRVFFGTRLEFEYARLGLPSAPGLPPWWHPGSSFAVSMSPEIAKRWDDARFGLVVMAPRKSGGYVQIPAAILAELGSQYQLVSSPGSAVDVYLRR